MRIPFPIRRDDRTGRDPLHQWQHGSGEEGVVSATHEHLFAACRWRVLKATYKIEPGEIDLCTFPLFALFGPALGMTCVIPDMDATRPAQLDPRKAVAQIEQFGVTNMFGSPGVIRRLGELAREEPTASAPLPVSDWLTPPNPPPRDGREKKACC